MTGRATFGDFATTATRQLEQLRNCAIAQRSGRASAQTSADICAGIRSAVHTMAGYADDAGRAFDALPRSESRSFMPWIRAAEVTRTALTDAEAYLRPYAGARRNADQSRPDLDALSAAVRAMTLGRDLLHTHLGPGSGKDLEHRSEWAPSVTSAPISCALLHHLGGWARQLAPHAGRAAALSRGATSQDQLGLYSASRSLWIVSWAIGTAQDHQPVPPDQLRLTAAIPVNEGPPACLPGKTEPAANLCAGVNSTAERLRRASTRTARSPVTSRDSFRHTAGCCAVTASNLRIILRTLGSDDGLPGPSLMAVSDAADRARNTWLQVAEAWDHITTETRGVMDQTATEAAALALWTGRLAYASPDWTPALGPRHELRSLAELADSPEQVRHLIDAVHHSFHTLTEVAEAELNQARTAGTTGRLVVPTRSLPEDFDVPYRFAPAPATQCEPLLSSYQLAHQASREGTDAVAEVAAEIGGPSHILSTLRQVARHGERASARHGLRSATTTGSRDASGSRAGLSSPMPPPPGPVERILLDLNIADRADLDQAAALDIAADQLILRAATNARRPQLVRDPSRSAGTAELITSLFVSADPPPPPTLRPHRPNEPRQAAARPSARVGTKPSAVPTAANRVDPQLEAGA
jgi:hypothetical protein